MHSAVTAFDPSFLDGIPYAPRAFSHLLTVARIGADLMEHAPCEAHYKS
jgi:hypothetical protein